MSCARRRPVEAPTSSSRSGSPDTRWSPRRSSRRKGATSGDPLTTKRRQAKFVDSAGRCQTISRMIRSSGVQHLRPASIRQAVRLAVRGVPSRIWSIPVTTIDDSETHRPPVPCLSSAGRDHRARDRRRDHVKVRGVRPSMECGEDDGPHCLRFERPDVQHLGMALCG